MHWTESEWFDKVRASIKVALVLSLLYVGYHVFQRYNRPEIKRKEAPVVDLHDDLYVHPPKSYATDLESARRKLIGMPLWAKEGYRWEYEPGGRVFDPLEKIVPTDVVARGGKVYLVFEKDGKPARFGIGTPERVYVDDLFFIKDPKELYGHWTDEMWQKVESKQVEVGMSEFQIAFALGAGEVVRSSTSNTLRIVEYKACRQAGVDPVRVTYRYNVAEKIEPIEGTES